jgi:DNA-binding HxlR family transcriptional regulator
MSDLSALTHRQWSLNVLVELLRGPDKKAGALARRLDVSRQTLLATLKALSVQGLIEGDQAEPALTRKGEKVAERGEALLSALEKAGATEQRKWALPILHALGKKPQRFGELKAALPSATPRAISMALKDLAEAGLVDRRVLDGFPPRTEYSLQAKARGLTPLLDQLAKL